VLKEINTNWGSKVIRSWWHTSVTYWYTW
jgi:hypothetical protein